MCCPVSPHRFAPVILLALVLACLVGCGTPATQPVMLNDYTMLLCDSSDPAAVYTFLVEDRQVLLMVEPPAAKKGGQSQARFFAITDTPTDLYQTLRTLSGLPADAAEPESPAAAVCWRAMYLHAKPGELPTAPAEAWFQADTAFHRNLRKLRDYLVKPAHAVNNGLPNWAFHTESAARRLNLEGR